MTDKKAASGQAFLSRIPGPSRAASPVLCAACGAALSFYLLFPLFRLGHLGAAAILLPVFAALAAAGFLGLPASFLAALGFRPGAVRAARSLPLLLVAFASGLALGTGAGSRVSHGPVFAVPQSAVTGISGILLDDPRLVSGGRAMAWLSLEAVSGAGGLRASAGGEITVFFREENAGRLREFGRGSRVFAEGRLQAGGSFGVFAASPYVFAADSLHVTAAAGPFDRFRTNLRLGLAERFSGSGSVDAAWGGLALALLLGVRDNLDSGLTALYRKAGISYILALSGMHLAVIIALVSFLLTKPFGVRPAAIAGAVIIIAYCLIVGPLPSLYRSALMYILGVLTVLGMLRRESLSILSMAFIIQLAATPQAGFSLSFILSYVAMAGILVPGKSLGGILGGKVPPFLLGPLALSIGAFIGTAGVVALAFGDLRPAGILAGIVVAPLTTVFMVGSMAWLAVDVLFPAVYNPLAWPLSLLYRLMEGTARLAGFLPGVNAAPYLVLSLSLAAAALLVLLDFRLRRRRNRLALFP